MMGTASLTVLSTPLRSGVPPPVVPSRRRHVSWDLLRCGFVLLVVLYHTTHVAPIVHPELGPRPFAFSHQVGASLLLVISAYFACGTLRRSDVLRYWWSRMVRLLPAFLVSVLFTWLVLRYLGPAQWRTPTVADLLGNLLLLGNWKPTEFPYLDGSYWTLPLQLMAFTAAALLWWSRWGRGKRLRALLWTAVLLPLAQWPLRVAGPPELYRMVVDGFGFHRVHLFVAGVAIWLWANNRLGSWHCFLFLTVCMAAHVVHNITFDAGGWHYDWAAVTGICGGIVLICLASRRPDWNRWVPTRLRRLLQWMAGISYGVYLIHQTVGYTVMRHMHDLGANPLLQSVGAMVTALVLGWLLTRFVERPAYRWLMDHYEDLTGLIGLGPGTGRAPRIVAAGRWAR